jgi:DNA-binding HxlR family transcriptional regulator
MRPDDCPVCPRYQRTAELLGRRWSAAVIRVAMDGPVRFMEFRRAIDGLSARLLAERLRELEAAGLIGRHPVGPRSFEYRLTPKGLALTRVVAAIEAWVADWDAADGRGTASSQDRTPLRATISRE